MTEAAALYRPPAPVPLTPVRALIRSLVTNDRDLLGLLGEEAYHIRVGMLGRSRRGIMLVNDPAAARAVMSDRLDAFPKNDLFVGALSAVVGNGLIVCSGDTWRVQRRMIEPAFSHIHVRRAFATMVDGVDAAEPRFDRFADAGETFSLDGEISLMTADVISRAIFSRSLEDGAARDIFSAFADYQQLVANLNVMQMLLGKPFAEVRQPPDVLAACQRIRGQLGDWIASRQADNETSYADIAADIMAARDPETGTTFDRNDLIDQIGVFFIAGHETTATALTWALFILSERPDFAARVRAEVRAIAGDGPIDADKVKRLVFTRAVFKEAMRLYPPVPFLPRVAMEDTEIAGQEIKRGAMVMVSPWIIHRHRDLWRDPDLFDPDRFMPEQEGEITPGAFIPFGLGPRTCVGAAFALAEGTLILARLIRRYDLRACAPETVRPAIRITTRPAQPIQMTVARV